MDLIHDGPVNGLFVAFCSYHQTVKAQSQDIHFYPNPTGESSHADFGIMISAVFIVHRVRTP
jgi:hypothetical protein